MNFKLQQTYPSPVVGLGQFNTLSFIDQLNSLFLYGEQKLDAQPSSQQPKKKIAFKTDKSAPPPTVDKISLFSLTERKWSVIEAKGKIPTARINFSALYMSPCIIIYGGKVNGKNVNETYAISHQSWTWKKLFSLDGPPASDQHKFFKISNTKAGLLVSGYLWLLHVADVKWELSSNQLPGSVWQKINLTMPQKIKFVWVFSQQKLLIFGQTQIVVIDLQKRQKIDQIPFSIKQILEQESSNCSIFGVDQQNYSSSRKFQGFISMSRNSLQCVQYRPKKDSFQLYSDNKMHFNLERQPKCSALVSQKSSSTIFYLDNKGQLLSLSIDHITDPIKNQKNFLEQSITVENNSCIVQQQNQQSSVLIPSQDSRVKIGVSNSAIDSQYNEYESNQHEDQQMSDSRVKPDNKNIFKNFAAREQFREDQQQKEYYHNTKKQIYNINSSHTNPVQKNSAPNNQRFKYKTEQHDKKLEQSQNLNKSLEQGYDQAQTAQVKYKLANILYNEGMKRKLLEVKTTILQNVIKKSEKFVLMLCKYGNQAEKSKHIEKVKQLRQQLQWNWAKQIYFRKQMEGNKMPSQVIHQIQESINQLQI